MRQASVGLVLALALALALAGCGGGSSGGDGGPGPQALTVVIGGAGGGSVASAPAGISCTTGCSGSFAAGTDVTLTAEPAPGSVFAGWSGGCTGAGSCTVRLDTAKTVTATFGKASYQLSGRISGLTSSGLALLSGSNRVTLAAGATSFTFGPVLTSGLAYDVVIEHQPQDASCTITGGHGVAAFSDVTTPTIACVPGSGATWQSGASTANAATIYGTLGQPSAGAMPGARRGTLAWRTPDGLLWLYSGSGIEDGYTMALRALTDLWTFDTRTSQWTWRAGTATGVTPYVASTGAPGVTRPGSRTGSATWVSPSGELWLFGGEAIQMRLSPLGGFYEISVKRNDLWMLDPSTLVWTWMGGSLEDDAPGSFQTKGVPSTTALPPARSGMATWTDGAGNVWLFGGVRSNASGGGFYANDLWKFAPATGQWTWLAGSDKPDLPGIYGTQGVAAEDNMPGGRAGAAAWRDGQGRLCMYGGGGVDANGKVGDLGDLWCFDTGANRWTWLAGASVVNVPPAYGEQGVAASGNTPGSREAAAAWTDGRGVLWLYGGSAFGGSGQAGPMADLWRLDPLTWRWTWVAGPQVPGVAAQHGELGAAGIGNWPGGRMSATAWTDVDGVPWLFGGYGPDDRGPLGGLGPMNDVWRLLPAGWSQR